LIKATPQRLLALIAVALFLYSDAIRAQDKKKENSTDDEAEPLDDSAMGGNPFNPAKVACRRR
jgi:hypothetical protein